MTTPSYAIIETAAKAIAESDGCSGFPTGFPIDNLYRHHAQVALNAAAPGLLDETHWLAPMKATEEMIKDQYDHGPEAYMNPDLWGSMRDAYLSRQG